MKVALLKPRYGIQIASSALLDDSQPPHIHHHTIVPLSVRTRHTFPLFGESNFVNLISVQDGVNTPSAWPVPSLSGELKPLLLALN